MKFSYSWLKQLVDINMPAPKLAEFLSLHAFETEVVKDEREFANIIIAKVTKVEKHPNADRLRVVELTDGKKKIGPVVCGAWNFDTGAVVALALPGAIIPHDQHDADGKPFTLTKATIRGVESQGMICSAKELGLGTEATGILLLNSNSKLGQNFVYKSNAADTLFDVSVPANRPDLNSYRGVAWEIAALTGRKYLAKPVQSTLSSLKSHFLKVRISDLKLCKKYIAVRLTNVKVGPSPKFIQERLKASGQRPINNVVDITNYVMLELGQPLHAFDAIMVAGAINVRKAYVQESMVTLDGVKRKLTPDMLVIADGKKVLAIAGVIGGLESGINEHTNELILESANFNAVSVRRTAKALGLRTDASARFEKSLPVAFAKMAAEYATELLEKYAGAKAIEFASAGVKEVKPTVVKFDPEKVNQLLGTNISASEQRKILTKLGFTLHVSRNTYHVTVPFWRPDVGLWQDLAEEVERYKGLDFIKPKFGPLPPSTELTDPKIDIADNVRDLLVQLGFDEVYTYSFVSEMDLSRWNIDKKMAIEVANPVSLDQQYLRPNLALNILKIAEQNNKNSDSVEFGKYFEIANVYWKEQGEILEKTYLFMLSFPRTKIRSDELIGNFQTLASRLGIEFEIKQEEEQLAKIIIKGKTVGHIGTVQGTSELEWIGANLEFEEFIKHIKARQYKSINRYPSISLDTSILVREDIPWSEIKKAISGSNHKLISEIVLIEGSYTGKNIAPGKKSVTFRVVYQASDRTLTSEEVNKIHEHILADLKSKFAAQVRD